MAKAGVELEGVSRKLSSNMGALAALLAAGEVAQVGGLLKTIRKDLDKLDKAARAAGAPGRKSGKHVLHKLTDLQVGKLSKPGAYADGGGLYLRITATGAKAWVFRYSRKFGMEAAKAREMGLGAVHAVSLAEARRAAEDCRRLLVQGVDPLDHRNAQQAAQQRARVQAAITAAVEAMTFEKCVVQYIEDKGAEWSNSKHASQWLNTLTTYAVPVFGNKPVGDINTDDVLEVFKKDNFWISKTETATRVRQRIEAVLDWAKTKKFREGDNPAAWAGHLENLLPKPSKVKVVRAMPSLPYEKMPAFIAALRQQKGVGARALEFAILNATRSREVRLAEWSEIDFNNRAWNVPEGHTKTKKPHRVPLGDRAIEILREMEQQRRDSLIFPSSKRNQPLSDMTLAKVIKTMNVNGKKWIDPEQGNAEVVPHGFRSTFSTFIANETHHPEDVREACLAHAIKSKVIEAYQRGDLFDKRRVVMADWQRLCEGGALEVPNRS